MRAELKGLHSPDVDNLISYSPPEPDEFGFLLQALIGPAGEEGTESFDMIVCTPKWLAQKYGVDAVVLGYHHIIMFEYSFERLQARLERLCNRTSGNSWGEIATRLALIGKWEFDNYVVNQ